MKVRIDSATLALPENAEVVFEPLAAVVKKGRNARYAPSSRSSFSLLNRSGRSPNNRSRTQRPTLASVWAPEGRRHNVLDGPLFAVRELDLDLGAPARSQGAPSGAWASRPGRRLSSRRARPASQQTPGSKRLKPEVSISHHPTMSTAWKCRTFALESAEKFCHFCEKSFRSRCSLAGLKTT
jgi:hypothetical protein